MICRKPYVFIMTAVLASSAAYGITASDIVRKAQSASAHVSYRGTKEACIVTDGRPVCSVMHVTHMKPDKTRTQYSSPKLVAGVVVVQSGANTWKRAPRAKEWEQLHYAALAPPAGMIDVALANYNVRLIGSQKMAGRDAYVVMASPKRVGESVMRLWIDKHSYLTLRTQEENPPGRITSSSRFTSITLNPPNISPSLFAVKAKGGAASSACKMGFRVIKPRYLPKGYKLVGQTMGEVSSCACVHLQFSNGVNTLSLFERCCGCGVKAPKVPAKCAGVMTWVRRDMLFTLVGDLPRAELQKIADSTK